MGIELKTEDFNKKLAGTVVTVDDRKGDMPFLVRRSLLEEAGVLEGPDCEEWREIGHIAECLPLGGTCNYITKAGRVIEVRNTGGWR